MWNDKIDLANTVKFFFVIKYWVIKENSVIPFVMIVKTDTEI